MHRLVPQRGFGPLLLTIMQFDLTFDSLEAIRPCVEVVNLRQPLTLCFVQRGLGLRLL